MTPETITPGSWSELIDALYAQSWHDGLQRYRSPFAFHGRALADEPLSSGLLRLAAGRPNVAQLELHLLRNFRKYAYGQSADSIWHWLAIGRRGSSTGRTRRSSHCTSRPRAWP
jgi:hypothetical protein